MNEGLFWTTGGEARARGKFTKEAGHNAKVQLTNEIVNDPRTTVEHPAPGLTSIEVSGDPAKDVAAFTPIDLHGQLDSGELVSLLSAQNHGGGGLFPPRYVARIAVSGAHVSNDQLYNAVRFRIDVPYWTAHLADGESHQVPDDGSVLRTAAPEGDADKGIWLVYESAHPRSLLDLDLRVLSSCLALARLALDQPLAIRTIEVRIHPDSAWLPLHSAGFSAPVSDYGPSLLPREELTVERFANWIALNSRLDGLASGVYELGTGTVQSQVVAGTSLIEGLHRRLPYEQSLFPTASRSARDHIKKAARAAAERAATEKEMDPHAVRAAVKDAVCHFEQVGYRTRAQNITDEVTSALPELVESVPDLAGKLMTARNDIAHHLVIDNEKEPFTDRINRWAVISIVTPWLLRLLLLLRAGIEPDVLHTSCLRSNRFGFVRANIADIAHDLGWLATAD